MVVIGYQIGLKNGGEKNLNKFIKKNKQIYYVSSIITIIYGDVYTD